MKILHIIKSLGRGGAEMLLQETLKHHDRSRFEFHYIYFLPWKDQMVEGLLENGGKVKNFPASNNIQIMLQYKKVMRYIQQNKIDLVHCHLPWAGFLGRWIHRLSGIPVIYSEHNKQERYHVLTKTLNKLSFNSQSAAVAVSHDVADSIEKNIHPSIPIYTISNGVNTARFVRDHDAGKKCRQQHGIPDDAILIGNIAVFRSQKRLKEWIELFYEVHQHHPQVYGCLVGDGLLKDEIVAHIQDRGLSNRIILPGIQKNVIPWLSAIDIFLMTSEFEGLPIALLEAMSMECVVVCTDAGGIKEVIRNRKDGYMVPVEEWKSMGKILDTLIVDKGNLKNWGFAARKRVTENFSIDQMIRQTEYLYNSFDKGQ